MRKRLFFIGIGGYGISAIARVMHEMGYSVSGSDRTLSPLAENLRIMGITVYEGHHRNHIVGMDMVIRSSAVTDDNPEVIAAREAGIPVLKRAEFLGELMENFTGIAIAGTHGKTTTTAMLAWLFSALDQDPGYIIGGVSRNLGTNAHAGQGKYFIIEADEYDRMFLGLKPNVAVITNSEHDHPDCFPTASDYHQAFLAFVRKIKPEGYLVICGDDSGNQALMKQSPKSRLVTYGFSPENDYIIDRLSLNENGCYQFTIEQRVGEDRKALVDISLSIPGKHNVLNATAALIVAHREGLDLRLISRLLHQFSGTGRRFDVFAEIEEITLIDDYAHHPTEIAATLEAARSKYGNRDLWVIWQPHTFSRTRSLINRFAGCFSQADHVIVTDIFASRENQNTITSQEIVEQIVHSDVRALTNQIEISDFLISTLKPGDIMLVLSAGDADQITRLVAAGLQTKRGDQ